MQNIKMTQNVYIINASSQCLIQQRTICLSFSIFFPFLECDDYDDDDKMMTLTPQPPPSCLMYCQTSIHFTHMHYFPAFIGFFHMIPSGTMDTGFTVYTSQINTRHDTEHTLKCWQSAMYIWLNCMKPKGAESLWMT